MLRSFSVNDGRQVMQIAAVHLPDSGAVTVYIQDTDELGLWIRAGRRDGDHLLLVRWEYVLSIDILPGEKKTVGIRA